MLNQVLSVLADHNINVVDILNKSRADALDNWEEPQESTSRQTDARHNTAIREMRSRILNNCKLNTNDGAYKANALLSSI